MNMHVKPYFFESHQVRVIILNNDPWFVAADVCRALKISNPTMSLRALDDDEQALSLIEGLSRGNDLANIINESGLYTIILRSRDAVKRGTVPHRFRKWITGEVLPQIRKTGRYVPEARQAIPIEPPHQLAHEKMTAADMDRLANLVGTISRSFKYKNAWVAGIWFALRKATGTPSPEPFDTRHTQLIANECKRIWYAANACNHYISEAERDFLKRVIRNGENYDVFELFNAEKDELTQYFNQNVSIALQPFQQAEIDKFLDRK